MLWRVKSDLALPVLQILPDGSYLSVLVSPRVKGKARQALIDAARGGEDLDDGKAALVRVVEYEVPDRDGDGTGELIALMTTITDPRAAPASLLAEAYHQRWEHETGNDQIKTHLRGPGRVLRSKSPDMIRQEIYGYLLAHHAISALVCQAATETGHRPGPGQVHPHRPPGRRLGGLFPDQYQHALAAIKADITRTRHLNPQRRHRTCPRVVKRARHNSYRVKRNSDRGTRHSRPPTIRLANLGSPRFSRLRSRHAGGGQRADRSAP